MKKQNSEEDKNMCGLIITSTVLMSLVVGMITGNGYISLIGGCLFGLLLLYTFGHSLIVSIKFRLDKEKTMAEYPEYLVEEKETKVDVFNNIVAFILYFVTIAATCSTVEFTKWSGAIILGGSIVGHIIIGLLIKIITDVPMYSSRGGWKVGVRPGKRRRR